MGDSITDARQRAVSAVREQLENVRSAEREVERRRLALGKMTRGLNEHMSLRHIGEALGVSHNTVREWITLAQKSEEVRDGSR